VIARTAVFIRPGNRPHPGGLLAGLGCEVNATGFVTVDATGRTSASGGWAAGNVVDPRAQVITSAGAGSAAAIAINADLVQEDTERAVEDHEAAGDVFSAAEARVTQGQARRPAGPRPRLAAIPGGLPTRCHRTPAGRCHCQPGRGPGSGCRS
jgi:hypothetical protein